MSIKKRPQINITTSEDEKKRFIEIADKYAKGSITDLFWKMYESYTSLQSLADKHTDGSSEALLFKVKEMLEGKK